MHANDEKLAWGESEQYEEAKWVTQRAEQQIANLRRDMHRLEAKVGEWLLKQSHETLLLSDGELRVKQRKTEITDAQRVRTELNYLFEYALFTHLLRAKHPQPQRVLEAWRQNHRVITVADTCILGCSYSYTHAYTSTYHSPVALVFADHMQSSPFNPPARAHSPCDKGQGKLKCQLMHNRA